MALIHASAASGSLASSKVGGLHGIEMLILGDSRLAVDVFPTRIILQLLSKLLLRLQELPHQLSLGDHKLHLNGHFGRRRRSVTPACTKTIGRSTSLSHQLKSMRISLVTYSQACLHYSQEEYAE
jgi:hypothetical protein